MGGADNGNGYVRVTRDGQRQYLHHVVTELELGPIPPGMLRDHSCHDPRSCDGGMTCPHRRCMRHVVYIPAAENTAKARCSNKNRRVTHCPQGHPYDEENTKSPPSMKGRRNCHQCKMAYQQRYRAAQREARSRVPAM